MLSPRVPIPLAKAVSAVVGHKTWLESGPKDWICLPCSLCKLARTCKTSLDSKECEEHAKGGVMALKYFTQVMIERKNNVQQPESTLITSTSMFCHHLDLIKISRFSLSNNPLFATHVNTSCMALSMLNVKILL